MSAAAPVTGRSPRSSTKQRRAQAQVGNGRVVCGLSGGVDSTVAASLIHRAVGDRLQCIFVDNGLLRLNEARQVMERYKKLQLPVHPRRCQQRAFLDRLAGVTDPEQKRKIIGKTFIDVSPTRRSSWVTSTFSRRARCIRT